MHMEMCIFKDRVKFGIPLPLRPERKNIKTIPPLVPLLDQVLVIIVRMSTHPATREIVPRPPTAMLRIFSIDPSTSII